MAERLSTPGHAAYFSPSTAIRPLGEEHLKMFQRTIGKDTGQATKVIVSKVAVSIPEVLLISNRSQIPAGYRPSTMDEVIFRYRIDANFREELSRAEIVIIEQKGEGREGFHRIEIDGQLTKITKEEFDILPAAEKASIKPGVKKVIFGGETNDHLAINAGYDNDYDVPGIYIGKAVTKIKEAGK